MTKKDIIDLIESMNKSYDVSSVINNDDKNKYKIGTSQFMELSNICKSAECYEEIDMLVKYNIAKNIEQKKDKKTNTYSYSKKSWAKECKSKNKLDKDIAFGEIILNIMQKIKTQSCDNENTLKNLSLFFGYLFWQSKVWATKTNGR